MILMLIRQKQSVNKDNGTSYLGIESGISKL